MQQQHLRYPGCKWNKHLAIMNHPKLKPYLPQTKLLSEESFYSYIERFSTVIIKPTLGGGGKGIMKIIRTQRGYDLYYHIYRRSFINKRVLLKYVMHRCQKRKYIIQQGIDLIRASSRHVDFRVILLKIEGEWEFMGIIGKCAARQKFVTNHTSGGRVIRFRTALQQSLQYSKEQCDKMENKIRTLSKTIASVLNDNYPNITELGLDIAVDTKEKVWLLEANTRPHFNLFKSHEDQTLYSKILKHTNRLRSLQPTSSR